MKRPVLYYYAAVLGTATGTPCVFGSRTNVTGNSSSMGATENITGAANAVVTLQVTSLTNSNPLGNVTVNSASVYLNNTFTVTLNASGNGSFNVGITGDPSATGTAVSVVFTIVAVSIGQIGSPYTQQESKVF